LPGRSTARAAAGSYSGPTRAARCGWRNRRRRPAGQLGQHRAGPVGRDPGEAGRGADGDVRAWMQTQQPEQPRRASAQRTVGPGEHRSTAGPNRSNPRRLTYSCPSGNCADTRWAQCTARAVLPTPAVPAITATTAAPSARPLWGQGGQHSLPPQAADQPGLTVHHDIDRPQQSNSHDAPRSHARKLPWQRTCGSGLRFSASQHPVQNFPLYTTSTAISAPRKSRSGSSCSPRR
jgi:hypothetical protein